MLRLSARQMQSGQRQVQERFIETLSVALSLRYDIPLDATLRDFVDRRRETGLALGFETDRQIADLVEACLLTRDAILNDAYFVDLMRRPLMRAETKAETILRRWVWPHPAWRPVTVDEDN